MSIVKVVFPLLGGPQMALIPMCSPRCSLQNQVQGLRFLQTDQGLCIGLRTADNDVSRFKVQIDIIGVYHAGSDLIQLGQGLQLHV